MHAFYKYFYHKWVKNTHKWYPFLSVYYLTYDCDFRCPYCSDGSQQPYYSLQSDHLSGASAISLLEKIRLHCDYIVLTGGEPLNHPDFKYIMSHINKFRYKNIILTTNGYELEHYLPVIAPNVHSLVISIDTLDHEKADAWFGAGQGTLKKILNNINIAAAMPKRQYDIIISSVVTPDNIQDLYGVYEYSKKHGFTFAACPQLVGVNAHDLLSSISDYQQFYNFLIGEKNRGGPVYGTVLYLKYMRDFIKFRCHPFTMLVISPKGDIFYPCLEIGRFAGNLMENSNLHDILLKGKNLFGPQPECGNQCHSACALGFSLILDYPYSMLHEAFLKVKSILA